MNCPNCPFVSEAHRTVGRLNCPYYCPNRHNSHWCNDCLGISTYIKCFNYDTCGNQILDDGSSTSCVDCLTPPQQKPVDDAPESQLPWKRRALLILWYNNLRGMEGKDVILIGVIIAAIAIPIWAGENAGYAIIIEAFIWWAYMIGKSIGSD